MAEVQTVRGPLDTERLGRVLAHEHVFLLDPELAANHPEAWGSEDERVGDAVARLRALKERGIDTIADPTVLGLGRYIPRIQRIAEQVDLNIVVATGLYTYNDVPLQFGLVGPGAMFDLPEPLTELFVKDIEQGIADTGVRAAFLKCAIDHHGMTPGVERVMRAVARAHLRTGAPIMVHTHAHNGSALAAQDLLAKEGVDLAAVQLAHCGDTTDLDYLRSLADRGSLLGMDRFGLDVFLPLEQRVATVAELCRQGYAERMVLSHDSTCFIDWFPEPMRAAVAPNWHYTHISDDVLPALRAAGVTEDQIDTMLVDNPRRYLAGDPRRAD
ncbi:MAG: phosphotriesterase family protein [Sporichthyaceae bacterium]